MKKLFSIITLIFITFTATISAQEPIAFTLTTVDDKKLTVSETKDGLDFHEFKGKAILLTLFGHRCPPCLKEIPELIELTNEHKNNLEIIAIEAQLYPKESLKEFVAEHKMNYNVIAGFDHDDFVAYLANRAGYTKGIPLPLLIAINKNGEVESVQAGLVGKSELEQLVKDLND